MHEYGRKSYITIDEINNTTSKLISSVRQYIFILFYGKYIV